MAGCFLLNPHGEPHISSISIFGQRTPHNQTPPSAQRSGPRPDHTTPSPPVLRRPLRTPKYRLSPLAPPPNSWLSTLATKTARFALCRNGTQIGNRQEEEVGVHAVLRREAHRVEGAPHNRGPCPSLPCTTSPLPPVHILRTFCHSRLLHFRQAAGKKYAVPEQGKMLGAEWKTLTDKDKEKYK